MTATPGSKGRTTRRIVGSLGVLGAAAAVAGLGTFGTFTDSTTPVDAQVSTGTLAIDLDAANSTASLPLPVGGLVPGDTISRSYDLVNTGDLGMSAIDLSTVATTSSVLDTDRTNGLQLSVQSCPTSWTETRTGSGATYACASTPTLLSAGAAVGSSRLTTVASLSPGGTDHLLFSLGLPADAGNGFEGAASTLQVTFTGTQKAGTDR